MAEQLMTCRLCLRERKLANSHIIPEFCYKRVYDDRHRLHELTTDVDVPNKSYLQKGIREKLLCVNCERQLAVYEKYVSEVLFGGVEITIERRERSLRIWGIDYSRFKLFQLSILWRASLASHENFSAVDLRDHEDVIRTMILSEEAGEPWEYGCALSAVLTGAMQPAGETVPVSEIMMFPECTRLYGHNSYRMTFGFNTWTFIVSKHSRQFPHQEFFISKEGSILIPLVKAEDTDYFVNWARDLKSGGKLK